MLTWAFLLFVAALSCAFMGFAPGLGKVLFFIFLVLSCTSIAADIVETRR